MPNSPNNALQTRIPPASRHAMHGVVLRGVRLSGTGKYAAGINNDIPRQTLQLVFIDKPISFQMFRSSCRLNYIQEQCAVRFDKMDRTEKIEKLLHKRITLFRPHQCNQQPHTCNISPGIEWPAIGIKLVFSLRFKKISMIFNRREEIVFQKPIESLVNDNVGVEIDTALGI